MTRSLNYRLKKHDSNNAAFFLFIIVLSPTKDCVRLNLFVPRTCYSLCTYGRKNFANLMRIHICELLNGQDVPRGIFGWIRGGGGWRGGVEGGKTSTYSAQGEINTLYTS